MVAYPTEGVFGLGCDPLNAEAVLDLLRLKNRSPDKGLIVIAAAVEQLQHLVDLDDPELRARVLPGWPGPVTWVLPARPATPPWLTGGRRGLAVRVTAHPAAAALCRAAGPLVSTSANPSGRPPARTLLRVRSYFGAALDAWLPGPLGGAPGPTPIRDACSGRMLRNG